MDLSKLSMSELQALQKQLETQLKSNPAKEIAIADAMKAKPMEPPARMIRRLQEAVAQIPRSESAPGTGKSRAAIIGGDKFPLSPENTKALGRAVEDDVYRKVAKESVGKAGMVSGIKAREKMLASGKLVGQEAIAAKNFIADAEKYLFPEKLRAPSVKELTQVSGGMNTLGKVVGPAIAVAQGATVAQGIMDKMKAGESFKEAATNPELVKDAARGALGFVGANAGALAGSMAPGGLPAKAVAELAGAVGGGYGGAKLADLLTGNPVVDKIIRAQYEKARNERIAKTKPTAASSVELRPGAQIIEKKQNEYYSPDLGKPLRTAKMADKAPKINLRKEYKD